jgi:glycosyltransferase involved in cell wall biosynthesis/uncharacterized membrane protein
VGFLLELKKLEEMKIAVVSYICNPKSGSRAPIELAKALSGDNQVSFFALSENKDSPTVKNLKQLGVVVILIHKSKFPIFGNLIDSVSLFKRLEDSRFDVISAHTTVSLLLACRATNIPLISTYYGTQFNVLGERILKKTLLVDTVDALLNLLIFMKGLILTRLPDQVVAISKYTAEEVQRLYKRRVGFVYLGNAPSHFIKTRLEKEKKTKTINLLSVSRITPYKQFEKIIEAFKLIAKDVKNVRLIIVGSSPQKNYLKYLKSLASDKVEILTELEDSELIQLYEDNDIYVSADKYLFFGMPVLEATSFAKPAVALNFAAASELIVHGKTGFLAKDEKELVFYLKKVIQNRQLRKRLGQAAKAFSKKFSWEKTASKYKKVYLNITKSNKYYLYLSLLGLIILGLIVRVIFLNSHTFWFDEAFSFFVANRDVLSLLRATATDNHPPFYYLLLQFWSSLSSSVSHLRLLSLLFGVVSLPLFYNLGRKLTNTKVALFATTIFALSPLHVYFSSETRMYTLLVLETLLLSWLFLKFLENGSKLYLILTTLVGIVALHTHYYSLFALLTLNFIFLLESKRLKKLLFPWLISQLSIVLAFVPWALLLMQSPNTNCWCFFTPIGLPSMFASFAIGGMGVVSLKEYILHAAKIDIVFFSLTSLALFISFLIGILKSKKNALLITFFLLPVALVSLAGLFSPVFSPRSLIIVSPFYYLLASIGIFSLRDRLRRVCLLLIPALLVTTLAFQYLNKFYHGPALERAAEFISKNYKGQEAIIHTSPMTFYSFQYFHRFSYPEFLGIPSDTASGTIFEIGGYKKPVEEIIPNYERLWLVNIPYWVTPEETLAVKRTLANKYSLDKRINYSF